MIEYIIRRLLLMIPTFFGITLIVFFIINLAPGSPVKQKLQQMKAMNAELDMYKQQVDEFRYEISNVVSEHSGVKQEYIKRKQEHRLEEEASFGMMGGVGADGTDSANMGDEGMGTDLMPETSAIEGP